MVSGSGGTVEYGQQRLGYTVLTFKDIQAHFLRCASNGSASACAVFDRGIGCSLTPAIKCVEPKAV